MSVFPRLALAVTVGVASLIVAETAFAQDRVCRGVLGRVTADTVTVPPGATCSLNGTRVQGDVIVGRGSSLNTNRAIIFGTIKGDGSRSLLVSGQTRLANSIEWKLSGSATVMGAIMDGDIKLERNTGRFTLIDNVIQGDIQAEGNRGVMLIQGNRIDGNLKCQANAPMPTGGQNTVAGNKEQQCARL